MNRTKKIAAIALAALGAAACARGPMDARTDERVAVAPVRASTTGSCLQSFYPPIIGPRSTEANIIVDGSFETGCSNWVFADTFSTRTSGSAFSGSWFAQMKPYTSFNKTRFWQDINLVNPTNGERALPANVTFYVNTVSTSGSSWYDQFTVKLINPANNQVLQTLAWSSAQTPSSWKVYSINLTQPVTYYPDVVRLVFEGTVFDAGTRFQFDGIRFWADVQ